MKVSDYIVEYLIKKDVTDVFGYPGGMVTHLMDSFSKYKEAISAHVAYHEQGAAFAACGYAQVSGKIGVAYATSGPGATNLITGICNAYFDSIPTLFITGQVNTFEAKNGLNVRQRGFQETDIVAMVSTVTKYSAYVEDATKIKWYLDNAFYMAEQGRKGPVLLDIPMNILKSEIEVETLVDGPQNEECASELSSIQKDKIINALTTAKRPVFLLGQGAKSKKAMKYVTKIVDEMNFPMVSSMLAVDILPQSEHNFGFIGAYGNRAANFIIAKSDLVIAVGSRMDVRQVGAKRENFAPNAKLLRIDIDENELDYKVHEDETVILADAGVSLKTIWNILQKVKPDIGEWVKTCQKIRKELYGVDSDNINEMIKELGTCIPENAVITTDVGQNQVWVAQSLRVKNGQKMIFSGGHGAMGYSLPAAIGAHYGARKPVICFNGDGGFQMNMQELQFVARDNLPITIVILNNYSLGMIRHFQEMYFENNYFQTIKFGGYTVPEFKNIGKAYGIKYHCVNTVEDLKHIEIDEYPQMIEICLNRNTYVFPKLEFGKPNQDQEPLLDRKKYNYLMKL